jgi:hypothetical protein
MWMKDNKVPKTALKGYRREKTNWKAQKKLLRCSGKRR